MFLPYILPHRLQLKHKDRNDPDVVRHRILRIIILCALLMIIIPNLVLIQGKTIMRLIWIKSDSLNNPRVYQFRQFDCRFVQYWVYNIFHFDIIFIEYLSNLHRRG